MSTYYAACANTEAQANILAAACAAAGWDVSAGVRPASGEYSGGLLVTVDARYAPNGLWTAMQVNGDEYGEMAFDEIGAWIASNYVGDLVP